MLNFAFLLFVRCNLGLLLCGEVPLMMFGEFLLSDSFIAKSAAQV